MSSYTAEQFAAAQSQAGYASTGQGASSLSDLDGYALFKAPPKDLAAAYVYAAFFKGAAGRFIGGISGASLGVSAVADLAKARAYAWSPVTISQGMTDVLGGAYTDIRAEGNAVAISAAAPLLAFSQTAEIAAYDDSMLGKFWKMFDTLGDIAKGVGIAAGALALFGLGYAGYRLYAKLKK